MSDSESTLPPILDVRDQLDRIKSQSDDPEVARLVDESRELLDRYESRERGGLDSLVDDLDNNVLQLRERLDEGSGAARQAEGAQNRLRIYRNSRQNTSETLHVADSRLVSDGRRVEPSDVAGEPVAVEGTLVNQGDARDVVVRLTFYDDVAPVQRLERLERDLGEGERRTVELTAYVPDDAVYYDVAALDADATGSLG